MKIHSFILYLICTSIIICGLILGSKQYDKNQELKNRIDFLEKQVIEYEERCERMIDTNLDIIVNKRW